MAHGPRHLLVVGASGVIGSAAIEHFAARPEWTVTGLSRRPPVLAQACAFTHLPVDLESAGACSQALASRPPVTHMIYAAVREAPGLVAGWGDEGLIDVNAAMFENILDAVAAQGDLRHLSLLQGTKAYGAHRHDVEIPLRESAPRDDHVNFYWRQEDLLRRRADGRGFAWTIFRPQVLLGAAPGAAMNPVAAIGAYAALCQELDRPFVYPGAPGVLWELVDARLLAEAFAWALSTPAAAGETFNIANGDVLAPQAAWTGVAARLGLNDQGPPLAEGIAAFLSGAPAHKAWADLSHRHNLQPRSLRDVLGQSHHYLELLLSARVAAKSFPVLVSTIKLRQAGFGACYDSAVSLGYWLERMIELKVLPPFGAGDGS